MNLLMQLAFVWLNEGSGEVVALVTKFTRMRGRLVETELLLPGEALVALAAVVWPLAGVRSHVKLEVLLLAKRLRATVSKTCMRAFACVQAIMGNQTVFVSKRFLADAADEGFLTGMASHVSIQILLPRKGFFAVLAVQGAHFVLKVTVDRCLFLPNGTVDFGNRFRSFRCARFL